MPSARRCLPIAFAVLALTLLWRPAPLTAQVPVLTQHNDNSRTGANLGETLLTPANVQPAQFGKLFTLPVDGEVYAQPLYVPQLDLPQKGARNVVFVATMNNSVYAFDADNPDQSAPLWQRHFGPPVPAADVQCCCTDISVQIGILSTPVIDPASGTLYCLSRNKLGDSQYRQRLHALDLRTGADKFGGAVEIQANFQGIAFDPKIQNQRPALTLDKGVVYIAWASHNDCGFYHGWVMGYEAATLHQVSVLNVTPDGWGAGIWQSGQGLTVGADGFLYTVLGNGTFSAHAGGASYGNSVLKLNPAGGLAVTDYFTPFNVDTLNALDWDLGVGGVLALPGTRYLTVGSKEGKLYLLDRESLGKFTPGVDQCAQSFSAFGGHLHSAPVFLDSAEHGPCIYLWSEEDFLRVYRFDGNRFVTDPLAYSAVRVGGGMPGAMLSLSANAKTPGSSIVWANRPLRENANNAVVAGIVHAFDATTVVPDENGVPRLKELWNSLMLPERDDIGRFAKFCSPTIAGGKVYLPNFGPNGAPLGTGQLVVYGLFREIRPHAPTNLRADPGSGRVVLAWDAPAAADTYSVYRSALPAQANPERIATSLSEPRFIDTGLTDGQRYYYRVSATNAKGEGPRSAEVKAVPHALDYFLIASADTHVASPPQSGIPYGAAPILQLRNHPQAGQRQIYLKFDASPVPPRVNRATLRLYCLGSGGSASESVYAVERTDWTENGLTWGNRPPQGEKQATKTVSGSKPGYYEWDVTGYVQAQVAAGRTTISLALAMDSVSTAIHSFASRERGVARPQLSIRVDQP